MISYVREPFRETEVDLPDCVLDKKRERMSEKGVIRGANKGNFRLAAPGLCAMVVIDIADSPLLLGRWTSFEQVIN
jgi:hypothetical protein